MYTGGRSAASDATPVCSHAILYTRLDPIGYRPAKIEYQLVRQIFE